nr:KTSC domain-containing protein [Rhizobium laguerreae]
MHVWVYLSANQKTEIKQVEELSVKSKIIKTVYFSQEDGRLRICFKNGEERLFEGVPSSEAHAMTVAPSPGHYYLDRIRTRFRRLAA